MPFDWLIDIIQLLTLYINLSLLSVLGLVCISLAAPQPHPHHEPIASFRDQYGVLILRLLLGSNGTTISRIPTDSS
jgi:hypothetical protein